MRSRAGNTLCKALGLFSVMSGMDAPRGCASLYDVSGALGGLGRSDTDFKKTDVSRAPLPELSDLQRVEWRGIWKGRT